MKTFCVENMSTHKTCATPVRSSIIHDSQKVETAHVFTSAGTGKQNVAYLYKGLLFGHGEEGSADPPAAVGALRTWRSVQEARHKKPHTV